ncbi:MAG: AMP-binding protein [Acidimicrobiales bacterium]|nr:AMP-binding protein [Acidimicrobiales bacterium]
MTDADVFLTTRDFLQHNRTDYSTAAAGFDWPEFSQFNWATDYFDRIAAGNEQLALHIVEETGRVSKLTYADLSTRSNQVANFLVAHGVKRGDRILVMLGNQIELWETMMAAIKIGAVVIPATTLLAGPDLADRMSRGNATMVVTNQAGAHSFESVDVVHLKGVAMIGVDLADADWVDYAKSQSAETTFTAAEQTHISDPLLEYFTSGTTAKPKLVQHTQISYPVGHLSTMYWLGLQKGDVHWTISSPGWAKHAWSCFFAPLNAQATIFLYNYTRFDGPTILNVLVDNGVNTLCAPPTVWRFLIQEDMASYSVALRELISAGEPLNPEVIEQVRSAWGITIRDGYGQTETTAIVGNTAGQELKPGSMGRPMPGYVVELLDPDGTPAEEGEICIALGDDRPVGLMVGYADDPEKTAEVMRDGYYHTGDVGMRDGEGYITYVGRADDVFKASGYRISPFELESVLIEHPAVAEAAVVPSPDDLRGFVPKAYIILAPGHEPSDETAQSIFAFMRSKVSGYKLIRRLEFSDLPKTISGKIRRVELRGQETERDGENPRSAHEFLEARRE